MTSITTVLDGRHAPGCPGTRVEITPRDDDPNGQALTTHRCLDCAAHAAVIDETGEERITPAATGALFSDAATGSAWESTLAATDPYGPARTGFPTHP